MTSTLLPNTFQTPNDYIDQALELLTSEEFKCLMFAVRHIYGWQDKIGSRRSCISFTMFEHGIPTNSDKHYGGTGLARVAIQKALDALDHYKLLIKVGEPTTKGQEYEIGIEPDWEGLRQREADRLEMNRKRTEVARKKRASKKEKVSKDKPFAYSHTNQQLDGLTDYTQLVGLTSVKLEPLTGTGLDGLTESNPTNQTQQQTQKEIAPVGASTSLSPEPDEPLPSKPKRKTPHEPHFDALAVANGHDPAELKLNKSAASNYWSVASDLHKSKFPVERIPALFDYCKEKARHEKWSALTVNALGKYAPDFIRDNGVYVPPTSANGVPPAAVPNASHGVGLPPEVFARKAAKEREAS